MKKRGDESIITRVIIPILVFIIIIIFLFFLLKAASYSGRLSAKFGYTLAGSVSLLVNKPAQISQSVGTDGIAIAAGVIAAAAAIGTAVALFKGSESPVSTEIEDWQPCSTALFCDENGEPVVIDWDKALGIDDSGSSISIPQTLYSAFTTGGKDAVLTVLGNPLFDQFLGTSIALYGIGTLMNTIASEIQQPILNYLAPEGVIFIAFPPSPSDINAMYNDLNQTFVKQIENYCQNPASSECENIYLTYLVAKYLYYTWGETLGQSVVIAGSHNEYFIGYVNYSSNYSLTEEGVLCMLGMMNYFGQSPLKQMFNGD